MDGIYNLRDKVCHELEDFGRKGNWDAGDLDIIDKLAHTLKNLNKIINEKGNYETGDYRRGRYNRYDGGYGRGMYNRGYSSMNVVDDLRDLMNEVPDENLKQDFVRLINKIESR